MFDAKWQTVERVFIETTCIAEGRQKRKELTELFKLILSQFFFILVYLTNFIISLIFI